MHDPFENTVLAVIDIGGGSAKMEFRWAVDPHSHKGLPPKFEARCGLAAGINATGRMSDESIKCTVRALKDMKKLIEEVSRDHIVILKAVGTAPFRDAENGPKFAKHIRDKLQIPLEVVDGQTEAVAAARGVLSRIPSKDATNFNAIVGDMGGGSLDLVPVKNGIIIKNEAISLPLGAQRLQGADCARSMIARYLPEIPEHYAQADILILTGGTPRNLQKSFAKFHGIAIKRAGEECLISADDMLSHVLGLAYTQSIFGDTATPESMSKLLKVSEKRLPFIHPTALLLEALKDRLGTPHMFLSDATMRDGVREAMFDEIAEAHAVAALDGYRRTQYRAPQARAA